jgi:Protein of unknown function (DUF1203)
MTTTTTTGFRIHALPPELLDAVRAGAYARPVERFASDGGGGDPLRCCLRNPRPGEELILFGYEPPLPDSPYREMGAVIAHAEPCAGPEPGYPADWLGRPQVLRAYDRNGRIHDATRTHDGTAPEAVIAEMLASPGVERIHSRNVAWGCYMFAVTREG